MLSFESEGGLGFGSEFRHQNLTPNCSRLGVFISTSCKPRGDRARSACARGAHGMGRKAAGSTLFCPLRGPRPQPPIPRAAQAVKIEMLGRRQDFHVPRRAPFHLLHLLSKPIQTELRRSLAILSGSNSMLIPVPSTSTR